MAKNKNNQAIWNTRIKKDEKVIESYLGRGSKLKDN